MEETPKDPVEINILVPNIPTRLDRRKSRKKRKIPTKEKLKKRGVNDDTSGRDRNGKRGNP